MIHKKLVNKYNITMKPFILGMLFLVLWGIILLFGVAFYTIQKYPQQIASKITNHISNECKSITLSIESVKLIFSPLPKIRLNSVIIQTVYGDTIFIDECLVSPNFIQLVKGNIKFSSIQIIRPTITLKNNEISTEPFEVISRTIETCLQYLVDVNFSVKNGIINVYKKKKPLIELSKLSASLYISKKNLANITLNIADIHFSDTLPIDLSQTQPISSWIIKNTQIKLKNFQLTKIPLTPDKHTFDIHTWFTNIGTPNIEVSTFLSRDNGNHELTILGSGSIQKQSNHDSSLLKGQIETEGYFPINTIPTLVQLYIPFVVDINTKNKEYPDISINKAKIDLDNNYLYFNGVIKNYINLQNILLSGQVEVKKLSIPRWFGFTQDLPKGLQHALDYLSGTMNISITPQKIDVQDMYVKLLDIKLYGTAEVANLSQPIIKFDLKTDTLNINHVLPEIKGSTVPPLQYSYTVSPIEYAYIKEEQATKDALSSDSTLKNKPIRYDINIHADHADFLDFSGNNFFLHIYPETNNVKVTANYKNFYNGNIVSSITISDANNYTILINLVNIETQKLVEKITTYPFKGIINGSILSHGKGAYSIKNFLSSLDSTINLHVKNGTIGLQDKKTIDFSHLYINCNTKGTPINSKEIPPHTTYDGHWNVTLLSPEWEGSLTMDGPINFSTQTWLPNTANNISSQITFSKPNKPVLQMGGYLSFDLNSYLFTCTKFSNPKKTTLFSGQVNVNNNSVFNGSFDISTSEAYKLLSQLGYTSAINNQYIKNTHLKGNFSISPIAIQFSDTYGIINQTSFNISLYGLKTNPPTWKCQLNIDSLNLDDYLLTSNTNKPWPIELLQNSHIEGEINIQNIKYKLLKYNNLSIPFNLKQGILSSNKITALLYGGDTTASITIKTLQDKNIFMDLVYHSKNIDMLKLTKEREQVSLISGLGIFNFDIQTTGSSTEELIKNSHGKIQLAIQNGFFKEKTTKVARKFSMLSSNGSIDKGILTTNNATLTGPGFAIKGSGSINLPKWTLDYTVIVDTNKLSPSIPIHYFGSLSNPQYKINATNFILGAIGSLSNDTLGIIENIFLTPIKLFLP